MGGRTTKMMKRKEDIKWEEGGERGGRTTGQEKKGETNGWKQDDE
jgi:hypothetical protein